MPILQLKYLTNILGIRPGNHLGGNKQDVSCCEDSQILIVEKRRTCSTLIPFIYQVILHSVAIGFTRIFRAFLCSDWLVGMMLQSNHKAAAPVCYTQQRTRSRQPSHRLLWTVCDLSVSCSLAPSIGDLRSYARRRLVLFPIICVLSDIWLWLPVLCVLMVAPTWEHNTNTC